MSMPSTAWLGLVVAELMRSSEGVTAGEIEKERTRHGQNRNFIR